MDDNLQKLKRELRSQKCPPEVLARVRERIARERTPRPGLRLTLAGGYAAVLLLVALATVHFENGQAPDAPSPLETRAAPANTARVAKEATLSLACIGQALIEAGNHSEAVLRKEAVPALRNSLITLQTTLKIPTGT